MKAHKVFFFLLLVFLPTQLGFHWWPAWAHVLGRRIDYLSPTLFVTDLLAVLTLATWWFEKKHHAVRMTKSLLAVLVFAGINIYLSASAPVAVYKWLKVLEFGFLGWYIIQTKPKISFIMLPLSIAVFYSSVLATVQFFLQHSVGGPLWLLGERTFNLNTPGIARTVFYGRELLRPYATFPHPNVLGGFLAVTLPLIYYELIKQKKVFYTIALIVGSVGLVLTFSRSALVVGALGCLYIHIVGRKKPRTIFLLVPALFALVFFLLPFSPGDESIVVRQELNAAAIRLWQSSPLIGTGLGNFLVRLPETLPSRQIYFLQPVHNIYLLLLSEVGVVGIGLIGVLLVKFIKRKTLSPIRYALFALLLLGFVDHYPGTLQPGQLLLIILLSDTIAS